jgi:acetylornithine deacetylase/succinyl-diaminopimelate desuccinylase-like protein
VDDRTEYEKARDLRAKALRKEIALTLVAFGHVDVVPLGDLFGSALLPLSAMLAVPRGSSRKKILARGTA